MKCMILALVLALGSALPAYQDSFQSAKLHVPILRDDRVHPGQDGSYSFNYETGDGIVRSEHGSPRYEANGAVGQQGSVAFTLPNGEYFTLKFVANEHGYQPESPFLPVAPAFPHPIPQFVLDQIEKARIEDQHKGSYQEPPRRSYQEPPRRSYQEPKRGTYN